MHQFITILGASINLLNCHGCVLCIIENPDNNTGSKRKRLNFRFELKQPRLPRPIYIHIFSPISTRLVSQSRTRYINHKTEEQHWMECFTFSAFHNFFASFSFVKKQEFYKWQSSHNVLLKTGNVHRVEWDERSAKVIVVLHNQPAFWKRQRLTYSCLLKNLFEAFSSFHQRRLS